MKIEFLASGLMRRIGHLAYSRSIAVVANLLVVVLVSRHFALEEYATFRQTFLLYEILGPILTLGIPATIYYLLPRASDKIQTVFISTQMVALVSLLFGGLLLAGGNQYIALQFQNPALEKTLYWVAIYSILQSVTQILISYFIYSENTKFIGVYSSVYALIYLLTVYMLVNYGFDINAVVVAKALIPMLGLSVLIFVISAGKKFTLPKRKALELESKAILSVSIPFGFASAIGAFSVQIDKLLVSVLGTTDEFAIYVNGAIEIPLIGVITGSIAVVLMGELSNAIKRGDMVRAAQLLSTAASNVALIIFPMMIYLLINAELFITLLFSQKFSQSAVPFTIYLLLLPIRIVVFGSILISLGKTNIILLRSVIEVIANLILSVMLYKEFGYLGVAAATVAVTYFWAVPFNLLHISRGLSTSYKSLFDYVTLLKILLLSIFSAPIMMVSNSVSSDLLSLLLSLTVYSICVYATYKLMRII